MCIVCAMFPFFVWQQIFNEFTRCVWSVASVESDERGSDEREGKGAEILLPLPFLFITVPTRSALFSFHIQNTFGKYWYGRKLFKMRNTLDKLLTVKRCEALSRRSRDWKYANHAKLLATCGVYLIIEQSALTTKTQANCTSIIKLKALSPLLFPYFPPLPQSMLSTFA